MNTHKVSLNNRTIYAGSLAECQERARRERESWGPMYVVEVERIDIDRLQADSDRIADRMDRFQETGRYN